jgi:type IV secretion system protein VirD4
MQMDRGKLLVLRGGIPAIQGDKILSYRDKDFTRRGKPAPTIKPMAGLPPAAPSGVGTVAALQAQVATMAASIEQIRQVIVVERRMTVEEAAGEAPLDLAMVKMTLDDRDIELPPLDAPETDFDDWVGRFVDASFTPSNEITHA